MAYVGQVPVNDIVLGFFVEGENEHFEIRVASRYGAATAETIVNRIQPLLREGARVDYSVIPSRFAPED